MQFLLQTVQKKYLILSFTVLLTVVGEGASVRFLRNFKWQKQANHQIQGQKFDAFFTFNDAIIGPKTNWLPVFAENFRLNSFAGNVKVTIVLKQTQVLEDVPTQTNLLKKHISLFQEYELGVENEKTVVMLQTIPVFFNQNIGKFEQVMSCEIIIEFEPVFISASTNKNKKAANSVLASGDWYKVAVTQTGFYRLNRNFFTANGIDVNSVDPRTIKIYGNGAGLLPQPNSEDRIDDLKENAILVQGEEDGVFNDGDFVVFFAKSQFDVWKADAQNNLSRQNNIYSDTTYYFITFNQGLGKRIAKLPQQPNPAINDNYHVFCYAYERDLVNPGRTGRVFLGESFERQPSYNFSLAVPGFDANQPIRFRSSVAARSFLSATSFDVSLNGNKIITHGNIPRVGTDYESPYYMPAESVKSDAYSTGAQLNVTYTFSGSTGGGANGWLDFFEVTTRANLTWYANQVVYRVFPQGTGGITQYTIVSANANMRLFNVNDPTSLTEFTLSDAGGGNITFTNNTTSFSEFAGYSSANVLGAPIFVGKVANQNLHNLPLSDGIYITHPMFYNEAVRLASFHQTKGLKIQVVLLHQIYNEYSSGAQDITAIRDFLRQFYLKAPSAQERLKFVTLFGRASYDYKYRVSNNTNYVPTYESPVSYTPLLSYCSDDYYGFFDNNEGRWETGSNAKELLDIGIGRLPATTEAEMRVMVDKIINYNKPDRQTDWRNRIVFVADDEDGNLHQNQANNLANNIFNNYKYLNVQKILIDAYKEELIAGGARYPEAQKAISDAVQKGAIIVNYTGHGGELGWAAERILTIEDINSWTNESRLPLFVTATCEFSRFDDPARFSAGELTFLNARGGSIGLFTTVRLVGAFENFQLNTAFYTRVGFDDASRTTPPMLGEVMRRTKNDVSINANERNFTLLGDAAMVLAYPTKKVITTQINNKPIVDVTDTLKALSKVTIQGAITDVNGQVVSDYNGIVYPTVFDKPSIYKTLSNNGSSSPSTTFTAQNNIIYSGSATVTNGQFSFSFIVPKDISYQIGRGKISYYVTNDQFDGNGYNENFVIGGTADSVSADQVGPEMQLFIDDLKFVPGGVTNQNPLFIAKLFDVNGINTIGRGIGRELMLTIDQNTAKAISLNEYYKSDVNSYQSGEIRYQLNGLDPGKHTATLRAWDSYNNSSEQTIEFFVANNEKLELAHLLNYPNPFNRNTVFHFDHNHPGEPMTVLLQVFTISGKLVKSLSVETLQANTHFDQLTWDGTDEYGDRLANGVYIYKVKARTANGKSAEQTQKLVILN